jgi:MFS family permease
MTLGGWLAIAPASTSHFFGRKYYSKNYGFVFTAYGVGAILGVLLSGFIRDTFGSYLYVFYPILLLGALGMLLSALLLKGKSQPG